MTAPMTRERLALIRDGYRPALDDSYPEACVAVDVEDLRELLSACEALLNERENLQLQIRTLSNGSNTNQTLADDIERWRIEADTVRDAALEEAAKVAEDYDGEGIHNGDYYAQLGDARQTVRDITDAIRALKGKR